MSDNFFNTNTIDSDADSAIRGIYFQKLRVLNRLLDALNEKNVGIMCAIEYIDDVIEVDSHDTESTMTAEQDKLKATPISLNSHEVKNSIRIFFDNWREKTMNSEKIKFAFYTNTTIAKENQTKSLKDQKVILPDEPIIKLLMESKYDDILEPFKLIFKEYYLTQHEKNLPKGEKANIVVFKSIIEQVSDAEWKEFLNLIEWNFGVSDEHDLTRKIKVKIEKLCDEYDVRVRFADSIFNEIMSMIELGAFQKDFLNKVVHVAQLEVLFLEKVRTVKSDEYLDPVHKKWDDIDCDDIRNIKEKIEYVCPDYGDELEDLQDDYVEGAFEQEQHTNLKAVKAFKYRIYKKCGRKLKKIIKEFEGKEFTKSEIDKYIDQMTDECETFIIDKAKTYNTIPFRDKDMIRKTILILFEECYLAFDKGGE